jgi:hypothetical protein
MMHSFLLFFAMWFGLGLLFASVSNTIEWDDTRKGNLEILALLCILCAVFGPIATLLLCCAKWADGGYDK